jgi:tripartite-type tricarboxylate transporter receptor subunit TctC
MPRTVFATAALVASLANSAMTPTQAQAQEAVFPSKPVRIVLPIPAGSALDVVVRVLGEQLGTKLGQQVVVENRPGGGGIIAAQAVAAADPDGHTLLGAAASIYTILPAQKEKQPIDVNRDLTPVGMIGGGPMYLAVPPKLGVATLAEFAAMTKTQPHKLVLGTNGAGTLPHFAALALAKNADLPITILPYATGGTTEAIKDIMGGRVHATIEAVFGLRGAVQAGDLKLIAVMSPKRVAQFPSVPAVSETIPGFSAVGWIALAAPGMTPLSFVHRLNLDLAYALGTDVVKQRFQDLGLQASILSPGETKAFIEAEQKLWWPIVKHASAK